MGLRMDVDADMNNGRLSKTTKYKRAFDYTPACWCKDADEYEECEECGVVWNYDKNAWEWIEPGTEYVYKCRHYDDRITFPDGTEVFASSMHDRWQTDETPDYGLYLDTGWAPNGPAGIIDWPDFYIPRNYYNAAHMIIDAFQKAKRGYWVEVGCIGGHGRTGTVLACMAILGGVGHKNAVGWVRKHYCDKAIETDEQKWFVSWFRAYVFGGKSKPYPAKDPKDREVFLYDDALGWESFELFGELDRRPSAPRGKVYSRSTRWPLKEIKDDTPDEDDAGYWQTLSEEEKIKFLNDGQPLAAVKPQDPSPEEQKELESWVDEYLRLTSPCPCESGEKVMNCGCAVYSPVERTFSKINEVAAERHKQATEQRVAGYLEDLGFDQDASEDAAVKVANKITEGL